MISNLENLNLKKMDDSDITRYLDKLPSFIPSSETEKTFDWEQVNGLKISRSLVGEVEPIRVAVWFDDPNKDLDNVNRIHLRVINGRHRLQINPYWKREYYDLSGHKDPILEYHKLRQHFDMQKKRTGHEMRIIIKEVADHFYNNLDIPKPQVCQKITEFFVSQGSMSAMTVSRYCPNEYKDPEQQAFARSKRKAKPDESKPTPLVESQIISEGITDSDELIHSTDYDGIQSDREQPIHDYVHEIEVLNKNLIEAKNTIADLNQKYETLHRGSEDMFQKFQKIISSRAEVIIENVRVISEIEQPEFRLIIRTEEIPRFRT